MTRKTNKIMNKEYLKSYTLAQFVSPITNGLVFYNNYGYIDDIAALKYSSNVYQFYTAINVGGGTYKYNKPLVIDPTPPEKASILLDDSFAVHDIRIIEGDNGLFIAMPSRKTATGEYRDIAHPINSDARKMFEDAIIEAYNNAE